MNKPCNKLKDIVDLIMKDGANADDVIPYDITGFSDECKKELYALYIKYGKDKNRKEICKKGYDALC